MNKIAFIAKYNEVCKLLRLPASEVIVSAGGGLLMLGLRDTTSDLDLDIPDRVFDKFKAIHGVEKFGDTEIVNINSIVSLHRFNKATETIVIDGVHMYSIKELIEFKKRLISNPERNKEKLTQDKLDIIALEKLLKKTSSSFRW